MHWLWLDCIESVAATFLSGPDFPNQWVQIKIRKYRSMATVKVSAGLNPAALTLPDAQIVIVGKHKLLKQLSFDDGLQKKLNGVDDKLFQAAINQIQPGSSVSLYLDLAKVVSVSDEFSRCNSPSNSNEIFKELKSLKIAKSAKALVVVIYSEFENVLASVIAVARAFPAYSKKTQLKQFEDIQVEVVVTSEGKELSDLDLKFLNWISEASRTCAKQIDAPCNEMNSDVFAEQALKIAGGLGVPLKTTVIKGEDLLSQGFGGIYHVGKAADHPPYFVCLSHKPNGATKDIALVGKGIMFDTGGMQIKTKTGMPSMKCDMGGAAAVFAAFCTLAQSGFKQNLHCLLCIAENSVSPKANRPDDVITMLSGKSVEISNTDAEGRLVLADGVFYAKNVLKADTIIDMATLTGAQAYVSGRIHAAVLCNKEDTEQKVVKAGKRSGDLVHPLPYAPDLHFSDLKSQIADMKNSNLGSMEGPPSAIAGLFIASQINFSEDVDWIHVDIAAPAFKNDRATAFGPPLICSVLSEFVDIPLLK
ncbi:unnamed protein product [Bursaphelenchus okinawaensis]|uniref:Cytosol aminopeptidase domain-containing protein n=1 Tax=Bursaphelenchus okinawaensis TaxID=465554 RepID=A0A811LN09_9BILA|nr:unnamed protein product [Bursaphelenchus okinawaensis]CAG9126750.1 unnamed protein product [Bursaphelenchus okinawaensis]